MGFFGDIYNSWGDIQKEKYEQMMDFVNIMNISGKHVLDVGCGSGEFEKFLHSKGVDVSGFFGVDPDARALKRFIGNNKLNVDAEHMPFGEKEFDAVVCIDTVHLLKNMDRMKGALKKGGYLLIAVHCNNENVHGREQMITNEFGKFTFVDKKIIPGKEKELVFLFKR